MNAESPPTIEGAAISQDIFCPDCGYNLRGLTADRCPECGESIAGLRSLVSHVPWVHRKEIGWWRAYWRTVFLVMFRQRRFVEEIARPVSYADSQGFRWVTVGSAFAPLLLAGLTFVVTRAPTPLQYSLFLATWTDWRLGICWYVGAGLFLAAATGVPSYFFHPRSVPVRQQNRAIALSYYAAGPISLFFIPTTCGVAAVLLKRGSDLEILCELLALFTTVGLFSAWWLDLVHLSRRWVPQAPARAVGIMFTVPPLWLLLLSIILPGVVVLGGYLAIIFGSVR